MEQTNKKGTDRKVVIALIALAVAVLVLIALLVPTIVLLNRSNSKNDNFEQQLAALSEQVADFEVSEGITAEEMEKAISDAIKGIKIPEGGLTEDQVKLIIEAAIAGIDFPSTGLTQSQVKKIIADALKGIDTGLSKEEIEQIIKDALGDLEGEGDADTPTLSVEDSLNEGKSAGLTANLTLSKDVSLPAKAKATLNLNGFTLTIPEKKILAVLGELNIVGNGKIIVKASQDNDGDDLGLVVKSGGNLSLSKVDVDVTKTGAFCIVNQSGGTVTINGGTFRATDTAGLTAIKPLVFNNGTMTISGATFINDQKLNSFFSYETVLWNSGVMTLNNVTVDSYCSCVGTTNTGVTTVNGGNLSSENNKVYITIAGGKLTVN